MRSLRVGLAVLVLAGGMAAVSFVRAPTVYACSIDPNYDPTAGAVAIIYGRFDRIAHDPAFPESPSDPSLLTIFVERNLAGTPQPQWIEARTDVPLPKTPLMCPQFDRQALIGRYAVIALYANSDGGVSTHRLAVWMAGEQPVSIGQLKLVALLTAPPSTPAPPDAGSGIAATAAGTSPTIIFAALGAGFLVTAAVLLFAGRDEPAHARGCRCRACRPGQ